VSISPPHSGTLNNNQFSVKEIALPAPLESVLLQYMGIYSGHALTRVIVGAHDVEGQGIQKFTSVSRTRQFGTFIRSRNIALAIVWRIVSLSLRS
jgi:hypothetical protein